MFPEKNEITTSNNRIFQQLNPSDDWLKAVSSERLKRDIDMLHKMSPIFKTICRGTHKLPEKFPDIVYLQ